ncbi:MAG: hypothetical protein EB059_02835 [Alphaproteobacteria bacterium]|nr:hypothetical protein [Alphaproteobacteria bacterium]
MSDCSNEQKNNTQLWIASLGVSIFCCALFFIFMLNYISTINTTLVQIDERLASIEARQLKAHLPIAQPAAPVALPVPVAAPIPAPVSEDIANPATGVVDSPVVTAPSVEAPTAAPMPEAVSPVVPSAPAAAAPIDATAPTTPAPAAPSDATAPATPAPAPAH